MPSYVYLYTRTSSTPCQHQYRTRQSHGATEAAATAAADSPTQQGPLPPPAAHRPPWRRSCCARQLRPCCCRPGCWRPPAASDCAAVTAARTCLFCLWCSCTQHHVIANSNSRLSARFVGRPAQSGKREKAHSRSEALQRQQPRNDRCASVGNDEGTWQESSCKILLQAVLNKRGYT